MDVAELVAQLRPRLDRLLIALDFDGTLAPIVTEPQDSRPLPGVIEALRRLAARGARIAVITGRDAETVVRLGGLDVVPRLVVLGLYGAESWIDGVVTSPERPPAIATLRAQLPATLARADPDLWIEDKGLSLVVHARRAADPGTALAGAEDAIRALADELGLEVHPGRDVLEVRLPGFDKGTALDRLVSAEQPHAVLFAGDDLGDVPAFQAVRRMRQNGLSGWAVGAESAEVPHLGDVVDLVVDGPDGVLALLQALAAGDP